MIVSAGRIKHSDILLLEPPKGVLLESQAWTWIFKHTNATGAKICETTQSNFAIWRSKFKNNRLGAVVREQILNSFGFIPHYVHKDEF